ncbi:MAG: hypothetical protein IT462_15470 [Planctomycetes bacterium]|nr:hypothetical protein [Planctomycetota bacterium]
MALLIIFAGGVAYWEGMQNGITNWDDNWLITENRYIREISVANVVTILNPFAPQEVREELGNEYLPVRDLSYAINYARDGLNPTGYHSTNLILHLWSALLVMLLCARLTGRRALGFVAGLLFAVHPAHVEAVSWLSSRKDMLATFFSLLSINLYMVARRPRTDVTVASQSFVARMQHSVRLAYILAVLCFALALLSKMHAVVVAALIPLIEIFFARRMSTSSVGKRIVAMVPFWVLAVAFTLLAMKIGTGLMREPYGGNIASSFMTALAGLNRDFTVLAFGTPLQAAVDVELQTSPSPPVLGGALALFVLLALGVVGFVRRSKGDAIWPMLGFCALAFLAALAPVSNFMVQIGTVFAERYLYLPSFAVCLAAAAIGLRLWDGVEKYPAAGPAVRGGLVVALAAITVVYAYFARAQVVVWRDSTTLWQDVLKKDPANHIARFNLAREMQEQALAEFDPMAREKLFSGAYDHLQQALQFRAFNAERTYRYDAARIYGALALLEIRRDNANEAMALLEHGAREIDQPWRPERGRRDVEAALASYRGLALSALKRHDEALAAFRECLEKSNRYSGARLNLAMELTRGTGADRFEKAGAELDFYERERGRDVLSIEARARIAYEEFDFKLAQSGKAGGKEIPADLLPLIEKSRTLYREFIARLETEHARPATIAAALIEAANAQARGVAGDATAEKYFRRALELDPSRPGTRYMLASLLSERDGRESVEATKLINDELKLHPDYGPARSFRAIGLLQAGLNEEAGLKQRWSKDYELANPGDANPTWTALVKAFWSRENFRAGLRRVYAIFKEAADLDPKIEAGAGADVVKLPGLIGKVAYETGLGLWTFGDKEGRTMAEELLRISFNLEPVDGPISDFLTVIYLELAEKAVRENDREELQKLMKNMLLLSETARKVMGRRIYNTGNSISQGMELRDPATNEVRPLTEEARKMLVAEFMRMAILLDPGQIHALDWLKKYYEEEGRLEDALDVYDKFEEALKDRPDLLDGVHLAKGQTLFDLGQKLTRLFQKAIDRGDTDKASDISSQALARFRQCVQTLDQILKRPGRPSVQVLRMKGAALQRLAYFDFGRAETYYKQAVDNYSLAPLDFGDELTEVGRKLAWVADDPYKRRDYLVRAIAEAPSGKDVEAMKDALAGVNMRILADETRLILNDGKLEQALEKLNASGDFNASMLMRLRADIHMALANRSKDRDEKDRWRVLAAQDYVRAYTDAEAQLIGGEMYLMEIALVRAEGETVNIKARLAFERAERLVGLALEQFEPDNPQIQRFVDYRKRLEKGLKSLNDLSGRLLLTAQADYDSGRLTEALDRVTRALDAGGENPNAWQLRGRIFVKRFADAKAAGKAREAEQFALDAKAAYNTALRLDPPLTSQVLTLNLDMAQLLLEAFNSRQDALFWLDAARRRIDKLDESLRAPFVARIDELQRRTK